MKVILTLAVSVSSKQNLIKQMLKLYRVALDAPFHSKPLISRNNHIFSGFVRQNFNNIPL